VPRPSPLDAIDHVLALDLGGRGITGLIVPGAAVAAARALLGARRVLIVTGFCVPPGLPETDGLPGAGVLGQALRRLGAEVRWVTDPPVVKPLQAVLDALDLSPEVETPEEGDTGPLLARTRPTHLVAIERPGRARSGDYLSARGESIAPWNRPLDALFLASRVGRPGGGRGSARPGTRGRPITVGVGDGGNEIGMGNLYARLARESPLMAKIASVVRVDHLVVAGTSNWGAYGIVAGLERLSRRPLLHTPAVERRLIETCVAAGAVDGLLRWRKPTVDGLDLDAHAAVVELLRLAAPDPRARRAAIRDRPDRV
jgi:D-glutamate cyclase